MLVDLYLYVSNASPASIRAHSNLKRILSSYNQRDISLTVCDLAEQPERADCDHIAFTPTLFKRSPEPPIWIVGDLSNAAPLINLLDFHGVRLTNAHRQAHHRNSRI